MLSANISMYPLGKALKLFFCLKLMAVLMVWPLEPNIFAETGFAPCKEIWEGCLTLPTLSYRTGHQMPAGLNADMPIPQMYLVILSEASGQVITQGRSSLLHALKYIDASSK